MNNELYPAEYTEIIFASLKWLQVRELRIKYPNDADFGNEVAKLIKKYE